MSNADDSSLAATEIAPVRRKPVPVFTQGSTLRHVLAMTASGSIGLVAVFIVDFLSLLYVSRLGDPVLTASVGFASQVMFFAMSVNIAMVIAISATVSRALGAGKRPRAQRFAASGLVHTASISILVSALMFAFRHQLLDLIGARGAAHETATRYLAITLPSTFLMALGMSLQGLVRAVGDPRRAMYVTLTGAIVTSVLDPLLIFGFGLGVYGAAIATVVSRIVFTLVGSWGAVRVHGIVGRPERKWVLRDLGPMMAVAAPAILTNLATPVGNTYAMRVFASFGDETVAAFAIIDRIAPVAFGVLFALTGSIGPIIGQNYGAGLYGRIRRAMFDCFAVSGVYVLVVWFLLWLAGPFIASIFGAEGATRDLVLFFCAVGSAAWLALAGLFVANTAFNNLGFPLLATIFNWGRATLGTIPFVTYGAHRWGPEGGYAGVIAGAALFGTAAVLTCFYVTAQLAKRGPPKV
ncbi:MAG TPA: MATE family efflux transporter [Rhodoblastus sp.]|nr:MATE family efflux transporter [Rhodoblastus sp.]